MTEKEWRKIKYYPVSLEKLEQASMKEVAYLIAPMNIGEDYEYFDKVKHLLELPEKIFDAQRPRKSLDEIQQEFNEKIDARIEQVKRNFYGSKVSAESRYEKQFDRIFDNFEYAVKNGKFRPKLICGTLTGISYSPLCSGDGLQIASNFILRPNNSVGYYVISGNTYFGLNKKPNRLVRFMANFLLGLKWKDNL